MNIICFGDSITAANGFAEGDRWPNILAARLNTLKPGTFKVYNRGIGGNTTANGLDRINTDVLPQLPGMVLIEFGFNDGNVRDYSHVTRISLDEFKRNLTEMVRIVRHREGRPVLVVNHYIRNHPHGQGNGRSYEENFNPFNAAIRDVAASCGAPTIDLEAIMAVEEITVESIIADDGLHLSAAGNHLYAGMVLDGLRPLLEV